MKIKYITVGLIYSLLFLSSSGCNNIKIDTSFFSCAKLSDSSSIPINTLLAYPETLNIEGRNYKILAGVAKYNNDNNNISIFPVPEIKNNCTTTGFKITSIENNSEITLSNSYKFERFWLIDKNKVWETTNSKYITESGRTVLNGGPDLEEGAFRDVRLIVKFTDKDGKSYFIKSESLGVGL